MVYDAAADVARIQLADAPVARSSEITPGFIHEFDEAGRLLAIKVHPAKKILGGGALGED